MRTASVFPPYVAAAVPAALFVILALGLFTVWDFTVDDSYISLRYAHNLVEHGGLVWNVGEPPVEGFTNFGWVLVLALFEWLGTDAIEAAKWVGALSSLLVLVLIGMVVWWETRSRTATGLAVGAYLLFAPMYFHAVSGLETSFYGMLLTGAFAIGFDLVRRRPESATTLGFLPFLVIALGMVRPDGLLPGAWTLLVAFLMVGRGGRRTLMFATAAATVVGAIYMGWRLQYFGFLLPNTAYLKGGSASAGLIWLQGTLIFLAPLLLIVVLGGRDDEAHHRKSAFYIGFVVASIAVYSASIPLMDYLRRFAFPVVASSIAMAVAAIYHQRDRLGKTRTAGASALVAAILVGSVSPVEIAQYGVYGPNLQAAHVRLGQALAESNVPDAERTVGLGDAGAVPYFSGWRAYDFGGLNAPEIAHGGGATEYIAARRPTLLLLYSRDGLTLRKSQRGLDAMQLAHDYEQIGSVAWSEDYHLLMWVRKDASAAAKEALRDVASAVGQRGSGEIWMPTLAGFANYLQWRVGLAVADR